MLKTFVLVHFVTISGGFDRVRTKRLRRTSVRNAYHYPRSSIGAAEPNPTTRELRTFRRWNQETNVDLVLSCPGLVQNDA